ncbi:integrase catalytic domain-containing protein [Nephila pilipes]|uniref:Integrase catalytic domain-containing protein n=1 Tax=Nephila pilipes TaxID=299642 RepID=A0A8X6NQ48_NEPPI|nr:integrase catalytic domain-containing protein [Nephila pilipes]
MEKDTISMSFVCAKSRVAHLRKNSIPKLELLTRCIGARLSTVVIKALGLENIPVFYWSDSSTALYWIEINENWGVFVVRNMPMGCSLLLLSCWEDIEINADYVTCDPMTREDNLISSAFQVTEVK